MTAKERDDWIDRYLRSQLTDSELVEWDQLLSTDEDLRADYLKRKELELAVSESVLRDKRKILFEEEEVIVKENRAKTVRMWIGAAASILLLIFILWPSQKDIGPSEKYAHYFENDFHTLIKHPTMRSSDWVDPLTTEQRYAFQLFQAQLFEEAIPHLNELWENNQDSIALHYLGWSYIGIGEDAKGEEIIGDNLE